MKNVITTVACIVACACLLSLAYTCSPKEDCVYTEAFFSGEHDLETDASLANTFSYLFTGSMHISNPPEINLSDINTEALSRILINETIEVPGTRRQLAETFGTLMNRSLNLSNFSLITLEDIDQEALRKVLTDAFWANHNN